MNNEKFTKMIQELTEKYKNSIPENETELIEPFQNFLKDSLEDLKNIQYPFIKDNDERVLEQIKSIAENIISKNLEEKRKIFVVDKSMQKIVKISNQTYEIAEKKLKKKDIEIDFNISDRVKELKELLETVKPYNKEQAKKLISETVADLHFIEHPDTEFYSFRLSNLKKEEEQR